MIKTNEIIKLLPNVKPGGDCLQRIMQHRGADPLMWDTAEHDPAAARKCLQR